MYKSKAKVCRRFTCSSERVVWAFPGVSPFSLTVSLWEISSEWLLLATSTEDWLSTWWAELLVRCDSLIEIDWEREVLTEEDWLLNSERDSDSLIDWLAETESTADIVPRIKLSWSTIPVDGLISDSRVEFTPFSSANTGLATVVAPARAPSTTIPFTRSAGIWREESSYLTMIFSSTPARMTRKSPSRETDARTQFFPDLINL